MGEDYSDESSCKVEYIPPNSADCIDNFGPITWNDKIGGVSLRPYIIPVVHQDELTRFTTNYTVLNITFTNIKWKSKELSFLIIIVLIVININ